VGGHEVCGFSKKSSLQGKSASSSSSASSHYEFSFSFFGVQRGKKDFNSLQLQLPIE
jgi:hypothetical protein